MIKVSTVELGTDEVGAVQTRLFVSAESDVRVRRLFVPVHAAPNEESGKSCTIWVPERVPAVACTMPEVKAVNWMVMLLPAV